MLVNVFGVPIDIVAFTFWLKVKVAELDANSTKYFFILLLKLCVIVSVGLRHSCVFPIPKHWHCFQLIASVAQRNDDKIVYKYFMLVSHLWILLILVCKIKTKQKKNKKCVSDAISSMRSFKYVRRPIM